MNDNQFLVTYLDSPDTARQVTVTVDPTHVVDALTLATEFGVRESAFSPEQQALERLVETAMNGEIYDGVRDFGMDLATGPDHTAVMLLVNGTIIQFLGENVLVDPFTSRLDPYMILMPPGAHAALVGKREAKRDSDRPWVAMKRKPWERRR